jgi:hypothetical protein
MGKLSAHDDTSAPLADTASTDQFTSNGSQRSQSQGAEEPESKRFCVVEGEISHPDPSRKRRLSATASDNIRGSTTTEAALPDRADLW